jgi:hypothetical protein
MGFFDRLFKLTPSGPPNLTEGFALPAEPVTLVWDTVGNHLNGIRHRCDVSALAPLGPCQRFRRLGKTRFYCDYLLLGLEMEFCGDQLEGITFMMSESQGNPSEPGTAYATPLINPAGLVLTPDMDADTLTSLFGPFEVMYKDEEELIGNFSIGDMCYEAEFGPGARLRRLYIYIDE